MPNYRKTIEFRVQQRIPSLFLWRLKFQPATYNACEFFFSRIQIHVPPIDRNISTIIFFSFFLYRDGTNWLVRIWMQLQFQERHCQNAMNACCFSISEGVECATPLVSALETLERVIRNSLCTRRDFFFLSFFLSVFEKKEKPFRIQSCPDFDALWYYDRSTMHLPLPRSDKLTGDGDK